MSGLTTTYSHAAPYIRDAILSAAQSKLTATTQRSQREYLGQMFGLTRALDILLNSPEGKDSPEGQPTYRGIDPSGVWAEVERFLGGADRMAVYGFVKEEVS